MAQREGLRKRIGSAVAEGFFRGAAGLGRLHPRSRPRAHGLQVVRNRQYRPGGSPEHRLDIYRPVDATEPLPTIFYVHGGGFRILSKDTHWVMGLAFGRRGYAVVNVNYRLAPEHPFPAALEDVTEALHWTLDHADELGLDTSRLAFAGESAGANLVTGLTVSCCYVRPEPYAASLFARGFVPRAVLPYCGLLQVSDVDRFRRRKPHKIGPFIADRLAEVERAYLRDQPGADLADPLCILESDARPARPLPPMFATVGTADPLLDDSRRLGRAVARHGGTCEVRYYPRGIHAFHAFVWQKSARACWRDSYRFLDRTLPARPTGGDPLAQSLPS